MPNTLFGAGVIWGTPLTDASGGAIAVPTPLMIGILQDVSIDISFDSKMLHGTGQFPIAAGRGKGKITGKAKFAQVNGLLLNSLFFGQTMSSGALLADSRDLTGVAIPSTPFTITPVTGAVPARTWVADLGVRDAGGNAMTRVASAPTTGQYSVAAGVYTFAAADVGQTVFIAYQYTATVTGAKSSTVSNLAMGPTPTFRCDFFNSFGASNSLTLTLYACTSNKLSLSTKMEDFLIPEFAFDAFADANGRVLQWGASE